MNRWFGSHLGDAKYVLIGWVFLRGLALIYFSAFASMAVQIQGLIGEDGILPLKKWLSVIAQHFPDDRFRHFPTLFWLNASDSALQWVCIGGMAAAALLLFSIADTLALMLCYVFYLSLTVAGQEFTAFQWDIFLLEAGFLGLFLKWGTPIALFLYRWLIARFMFMSGVVKLASGDPSWANLTALGYHYETQPLPSPLAYYAYHLPEWFHKASTAGVLIIELVVPFFVFLPRPFRLFAAWSFVALQSAIVLTGNYNFFNLLTILLCLFLFEDRDLRAKLPARLAAWIESGKTVPGRAAHAAAGFWAAVVLTANAASIWAYHAKDRPPEPLKTLIETASSFSLVNNYGPFSVMTTRRNEITVEGSNDGKNWRTYLFKYKPVSLNQALPWNIPHQPRLDWQMWFAALERPSMNSWFSHFMLKLQKGSPV
ncbi:MAG: lipase maturation factor family protein [Gammaproteobacteria bacterium]